MKKYLLILAMCFVSMSAQAEYVESLLIKTVQGTPNGGFLLSFDKTVHANCTTSGTKTIYYYPNIGSMTSDGLKTMLSLAMVAFTTQKEVNVHFDESASECWGQYLTIDYDDA